MVWEPEKECMQREELRQLQLEQLQAVLARVYMHVPFYRKQFDACKVDPDDFAAWTTYAGCPLPAKPICRRTTPTACSPCRCATSCASTPRRACPPVVGYTRNDIKTWSALVARVLCAGGVSKDDVVQIAYGYDLSTGGFGIHYGAERIGASVIPTSTGNTARQIKIMRDFKDHCAGLHAQLRLADCRHHPQARHQPGRPVVEVWPFWRRTLVRGHAPGDPGQAAHRGH